MQFVMHGNLCVWRVPTTPKSTISTTAPLTIERLFNSYFQHEFIITNLKLFLYQFLAIFSYPHSIFNMSCLTKRSAAAMDATKMSDKGEIIVFRITFSLDLNFRKLVYFSKYGCHYRSTTFGQRPCSSKGAFATTRGDFSQDICTDLECKTENLRRTQCIR